MPYKDPEKAKIASRERKRRWREKNRPNDWQDRRGLHNNHARGQSHYKWKTGGLLSSEGYVKLRVGKSHPLADPNGYAYEHWVVWCAAGNPFPKAGELIHHKNGDRTDNRIENLELTTKALHNVYHNTEKDKDELGRFVGKKAAGRELDGKIWSQLPGREQ